MKVKRMQRRLLGNKSRSPVRRKICEIVKKILLHFASNLYDHACHAADTGLKGFEARQTKLITLHLLEQVVLLLPEALYIKGQRSSDLKTNIKLIPAEFPQTFVDDGGLT